MSFENYLIFEDDNINKTVKTGKNVKNRFF